MARIPDDFLVGTSSSAWQIEGNGGKGPGQKSWADIFYETDPSRWIGGDGPDRACDFYHRYQEDIRTMAGYGMRAFRFTIQWARFMEDPEKGIVSQDAVEYYRDVIRTIRESGMEPVVSLEHWDIPAVLFEKYNGWAGRETIALYEKYVEAVLAAYHKDVQWWFAFTEPTTPIDNGYMEKLWYPFRHTPKEAYQAHFHKMVAIASAVRICRKYAAQGCRMGVMLHLTPVYARSGEARDVQAAYLADLFNVRLYLDPVLKGEFPPDLIRILKEQDCMFEYREEDLEAIRRWRIDMLGTDYYFPIRVKARETAYTREAFHPEIFYEPWIMPGRRFNSDRGWEIYPQALLDFGIRLKEDYGNIPWLISENGIGIAGEDRRRGEDGIINDAYRIEFIRDHLTFALKAREAGCDLRGYLIWSYVDNLSALNAFKNRYGLLELDKETLERKPKRSVFWLRDVLKKGELPEAEA